MYNPYGEDRSNDVLTPIMTAVKVENLFIQIAHGDAEHRLWLRTELEKFWQFKMNDDRVGQAMVPTK